MAEFSFAAVGSLFSDSLLGAANGNVRGMRRE